MTEDEKQELLDTLRTMLDRMPQPRIRCTGFRP